MSDPSRFVNKKRLANSIQKELNGAFLNDPRLEKCKSLDLDEIFQFSAARERALERNAKVEYDVPWGNFVQQRVFINHVDSYHGKAIAEYLCDQTISVVKNEAPSEYDEEEFGERDFQVGEEEEDMKEGNRASQKGTTKQNFEIYGTVDFMKSPNYTRSESVTEILDEEKKDDFLQKILTCGFIIYDITNTLNCHPLQIEEATWVLNNIVNQLDDVQRYAPKLFRKYKDCRTFILISTVMTWGKTKPIDPEDPSLPFTERDYRKRKPHPNYKVHCDFEKKVLEAGKKFPQNLRTIVIGTGVTYGMEEDVLHFLFKLAWTNSPELPLFRPGNNLIPLIHVNSLAHIVHAIMDDFPHSAQYILAVEQLPVSLKNIVKPIAKKLGTGKLVKISKEEAFFYADVKQRNFDMLTVNLNIIPGYVYNTLELKGNPGLTFGENIDSVISEYRTSRNLMAVKILIHGPPASGKTTLSEKLADYYLIHHLLIKEVIEDGIRTIKEKIEAARSKDKELEEKTDKTNNLNDDEVEDEEDVEDEEEPDLAEEDPEELAQLLFEIEENMASNEKNRLDEQYVIRLLKRRLLSNACQNQGFIIDGYPKTIEDCKVLFEPEEEVNEENFNENEENKPEDVTKLYNKKIMPEFVASFDASDEFLIQRVIRMPQKQVTNTHYVEEEMCRRLIEYRINNTEDNTLLIYFDELDIYPMIYNLESRPDDDMDGVFQDIIARVGPPRNYGASPALEKLRKEQEQQRQKMQEDIKLKSSDIILERRKKMENWMFLKNQEKEMEEKALALLAMPLRHYLMKYIFPTLTRGLVEVARVRPSDPVDFLAEFLFKENPEGKMFQPNYDLVDDELAEAMKYYEFEKAEKSEGDYKPSTQYSSDTSAMPDVISHTSEVKEKCLSTVVSEKPSSNIIDEKSHAPEIESKISSGSCKCVQSQSQQSSSTSSSAYEVPKFPPTVCTCPPYPTEDEDSSSCDSSMFGESEGSGSRGSRGARRKKEECEDVKTCTCK